MGFLLDTNIISELRKGDRCHPRVWRWRQRVALEEMFTSVLVMGELRRGIEKLRRKDPVAVRALEKWHRNVATAYADRILPVTFEIGEIWGRLSFDTPLPVIDGLLAATALHHGLTLVTRNVSDVERSGVDFLNPFDE